MSFKPGEVLTIPSPIESHVHIREPGGEAKETIESGTRAAITGGYGAVIDMPNNPGGNETRTIEKLEQKISIGRNTSHTKIGFWGGVDLENPDGRAISDMIGKTVGFKLYMGKTTGNIKEYDLDVARSAIDTIIDAASVKKLNSTIALHARNEIGAETAEYILSHGNKVNWCHLASKQETDAAVRLKTKYPSLFNAAVTLHHLTMTDKNADFQQGWHGARMQPPLGKEADGEALLWAYNNGFINILETDHAPHSKEDKLKAETENPEGHTEEDCTTCYGVSGIEHVLPVALSLVQRKIITMDRLFDSVYTQPAKMLGFDTSDDISTTHIEIGPRIIGEKDNVGKSQNHPYLGWTAWGSILGVDLVSPDKILSTGSRL